MKPRVLDDLMFDAVPFGVQRIATTIQFYTAITPATQAKVLLVSGGALLTAHHLGIYQTTTDAGALADGVVVAFVTAYMLFVFGYCQRIAGSTHRTRNPLRAMQTLRVFRLIFLFLAVTLIVFNVVSFAAVHASALAIGFYLIACDSVPPPERIRKMAYAGSG